MESVKRIPTPFDLPGPGMPVPEATTIDLGDLKRWAANPNKTYDAMRFIGSGTKEVSIRLGRRARTSEVQTGYRIRISHEILDITAWESAPAPGSGSEVQWFPTEPLEKELTLNTKVYDCVQDRSLSAAEEESFDENGDPGRAQRLLINQRDAAVTVKVRVDFSPLVGGDNKAHLGEVRLTFMPADVWNQPNAYILDIDVLETHVATTDPFELREVTVEGISLHIIPSWLKVPPEFFDDYYDAWQRMLNASIETNLHEQLPPSEVPKFVDPRPKFLTIYDAATVVLTNQMFEVAERNADFAVEVQKFLIPHEVQ